MYAMLLGLALTARADELEDIRQRSLDLLLLEQSLPDPAAAVALSGFVGFGAGHVYTRDDRAALHTFVQIAGLGMVILAPVVADQRAPEETTIALNVAGLVALVGGRLVEVATAPRSARRRAEALIEQRRAEH